MFVLLKKNKQRDYEAIGCANYRSDLEHEIYKDEIVEEYGNIYYTKKFGQSYIYKIDEVRLYS